jgi:2'-5' RNA ligase
VTKERLKSPRARLFVALDLPEDVRERLVAWQGGALTDPALRPIVPQALHVTLCFLGYHPERDIEAIVGVVTALAPRPVELRFEPEPMAVPPSRPRLFAIDAPSETAAALQAELEAGLVTSGFYKPEKRPFWSHVTVARVRSEKGRRGKPRRVSTPPSSLPDELLEPFGCVRVALYRSNLRPTGAEYVRLDGLDLPPVEVGKR